MKNIIFLDIDGVLNNNSCFIRNKGKSKHTMMDEAAVKLLYETIEQIPDCKIVISSSWRSTPNDIARFKKSLKIYNAYKIFRPCLKYLHKDYCTKRLWKGKRGYEIQEWLSRHPEVEKYICLDDDSDYLKNQNLLQINRNLGFNLEDSYVLLTFFGVKNITDRFYEINTQLNYIRYGMKILKNRKKFIETKLINKETINQFLKDLENEFDCYKDDWYNVINLNNPSQIMINLSEKVVDNIASKYGIKYNLIFYPAIKHKEMCPQDKNNNDLLFGFILKILDNNISICFNLTKGTYLAMQILKPTETDIEWAKQAFEEEIENGTRNNSNK